MCLADVQQPDETLSKSLQLRPVLLVGVVDGCQLGSLGIGLADELDVGTQQFEEDGTQAVVARRTTRGDDTGPIRLSDAGHIAVVAQVETLEVDAYTLSHLEVGIEARVLDGEDDRGIGSCCLVDVAQHDGLVEVAALIVGTNHAFEDDVLLDLRPRVVVDEVARILLLQGVDRGVDVGQASAGSRDADRFCRQCPDVRVIHVSRAGTEREGCQQTCRKD